MAVKQYYYIDEDNHFVNTGTGNPTHQAEIEKMLADDVEKFDSGVDAGKVIELSAVKHVLSIDKKSVVEEPQVFRRLLKPIEFSSYKEVIKEDIERFTLNNVQDGACGTSGTWEVRDGSLILIDCNLNGLMIDAQITI